MIVMEGLMLVPPERGTLIGRALWKPRYVVLGTGARLQTQNDLFGQRSDSAVRIATTPRGGLKSAPLKENLVDATDAELDGLFVSIYKAKVVLQSGNPGPKDSFVQGDWEFLAQHPISAFQSCEIRPLQHRKQGPSLPTLMLELKPDPAAERQRRRRSSRTGLAVKDPWAATLLFRTVPEEHHNIYDWQLVLKPQLQPDTFDNPEESPLSPISPSFYSFTNPFASRDPRTPTSSMHKEYQYRPPTQQPSTYPHAPRERPTALISPSPSLRSRRSDLSSQASSLQPMGFPQSQQQNFMTSFPPDLPSPASTFGYETQFIEGWTSAQGRSSTLSSHTRESNSIPSAVVPSPQVMSTSPGPRETILDRAFQMKYIPGSERALDKDEEKISSIARFEALMKEVDEKKRQLSSSSGRDDRTRIKHNHSPGLEPSDQSDSADIYEDDLDDVDDVDDLDMSDQEVAIPTPAQRALEYIAGRREPVHAPFSTPTRDLSPLSRSPPAPFLNSQAMDALQGNSEDDLQPLTSRNSSERNGSQPNSLDLPARSASVATIPSLQDQSSVSSNSGYGPTLKTETNVTEKRGSSTSLKRLSFTEFAKRLSSTSSLLLVQTNASSSSGQEGSRRGSSEFGIDPEDVGRGRGGLRSGVAMRGGAVAGVCERDMDSKEKRCGWRGSVGIFGADGGFL